MTNITGILAFLLLAAFTLRECESAISRNRVSRILNKTKSTGPTIDNRNDDEEDFVPYAGESFNVFDWNLLKATSKKYAGNVLLSPISLKIALVLLYEGAKDETAHELATTMQLPAAIAATRERFSTILRSLETYSPSYFLNIGTRVYADSNIMIRQRYTATMKTFYNTDVISANLSTDAQPLVKEINAWVSNITDANIDKMIDNEDGVRDSLMLILNALYFKGSWRRKYFNPEDTQMNKFHTIDNKTINVPFMHATGRFFYSESSELDSKIIRIPYDGHKFSMYIVLPNRLDGIERLVNNINSYVLTRHVWLMQDLSVNIYLPKFKFQFSSHLKDILSDLGIRDVFGDTATLTGISKSKRTSKHLKVTDVLQKAGIEVNENGTTAYVATEIEIGNKIEDETFLADRPFLFYIEDETTGTIIYIGRIMNPLETSGSYEYSEQQSGSKFGSANVSDLQINFDAGDRNNLFNVHFAQTLCKENLNRNLILSPTNVKIALTMLMEGADGNTKSEIISVLRLPEDDSVRAQLAQRNVALLKRNNNGTEIDMSARLWVQQNLQVLDSYKNTLQSIYQADTQNINFVDSQTSSRLINEWIHRVTRDAFPVSSLQDIKPDTRLMLTSVIYFKGRWLKSFDKAKTKLECFYLSNGECKKTYMMKHESIYRYTYLSSIDAQILEIPYSDGKTSMLTLMPKNRQKDPNLRILTQDLITVPISTILANLHKQDLNVHLPKFKIEDSLNLVPSLKQMGIENVFGPNANLTKTVSNELVRVSDIRMNAKIEVDEEGTLAAADTEVGYKLLSTLGNDLKMDRPFIFMIVDTVTTSVLFYGQLLEP